MYWLRAREWDRDEIRGPYASVLDAAVVARSLIYADQQADIDRIWECEHHDSEGAITNVRDFDLLI